VKKAQAISNGRTPRPLNYKLLKEVLDIVDEFNRTATEAIDLEKKSLIPNDEYL
jgi:hypothetical protein